MRYLNNNLCFMMMEGSCVDPIMKKASRKIIILVWIKLPERHFFTKPWNATCVLIFFDSHLNLFSKYYYVASEKDMKALSKYIPPKRKCQIFADFCWS